MYYPQFCLFCLSPSTFSSDWRQWRRRQSPFWPCQVRSQGWTGSPCLSGGYTPVSKIFVIWQSPGLRKSRLCLLNIKKKRMHQNFDTPSGQARGLTCSSSSMFYKDGNSPQDNKWAVFENESSCEMLYVAWKRCFLDVCFRFLEIIGVR